MAGSRGFDLRRIVTLVLLAAGLLSVLVPSESAAAAPAPIPNVSYGPNAMENMTVYPATSTASRLVVLVHGGGWATESATTYAAEAQAMQAAGFAVFNVNYRLDSPTIAAFPMEIYDVWLATHWAIAHAVSYHADPHNVTLVGGSAGGDLVAEVALMLPPGTIKAVVTLSGAFDFNDLIQGGIAGSINHDLAISAAMALGCTLTTCTAATEARWSPADHVSRAECPPAWLLMNSSHELMPLDQPAAMTAALRAKGCKVTETIIAGSYHAIGYWSLKGPAVISFISAHG